MIDEETSMEIDSSETMKTKRQATLAFIFGIFSIFAFTIPFVIFFVLGGFNGHSLYIIITFYVAIGISIPGILFGRRSKELILGKRGLILNIISLICLLPTTLVFTYIQFFFFIH